MSPWMGPGRTMATWMTMAGHPTFVLVRESTVSDPVKGKLVEGFKNSGATLVHVSSVNFSINLTVLSIGIPFFPF